MDKSGNKTLAPSLCAKGCEFYGNPATNDLCSKCYNDYLQHKLVLAIPATNPFPCFKGLISTSGSGDDTTAKDIDDVTISPTTKTSSNRCQACKKKVRLTGFGCRCGLLFCVEHRYPEAHGCEKLMEYKEKGRVRLVKENPIIMVDKLEDRV